MAKVRSLRQAIPGVWELLKYMWPYLRQHRTLIAGSFMALFAGVLMRALEPWPLKLIIDHVIIPQTSASPASTWIDSLEPLTFVAGASFTLVLILALRALCTYWQKVGFALVGNKVLTRVRTALYRHIQCLSLTFHNKARGGDLLVRVIGDIGLLKDVAVTTFMPLIGSVLVLASSKGADAAVGLDPSPGPPHRPIGSVGAPHARLGRCWLPWPPAVLPPR